MQRVQIVSTPQEGAPSYAIENCPKEFICKLSQGVALGYRALQAPDIEAGQAPRQARR